MASSWPEARERSILHLNVADFAVAVERVIEPRLKDRPIIIAPLGAVRAAVYDMSEESFQAGVRKGMALRRAMRLCKDAEVLPPHPDRYERAMEAFFRQSRPYSPLIETEEVSGHLFVDLTGTGRLFGPPADIAWRIRKASRSDLRLDPIWSIASNKLVAKVATRLVKPVGEYIVEAGDESSFLKPLPIHLLPGLERDDITGLREFNVARVGQAAGWSLEQLDMVFGSRAKYLHRTLQGIDNSPVLAVGQKPLKVKRAHEFPSDTNDVQVVEAALYRLVEQAGRDLRKRNLVARRIGIILDYSDGVRAIRQRASPGTNNDFKLFARAKSALELAWKRRVRIRHMSLALDRLINPPAQLELFPVQEEDQQKNENLVKAIDQVRGRLGASLIQMGRNLAVEQTS